MGPTKELALRRKKALGISIWKTSRITGNFTLRSGATSQVYFDKYLFEADPKLLTDIALEMSDLLPAGTERLIGLEMGGIPLVTAISLCKEIKAGFCRKIPKDYGTCLQVEGGVKPGEKVVVVEDVITSGGAVMGAIKALRDLGVEILGLICVVDREAGAAAKFKELGVEFWPLFTWSELDALASSESKTSEVSSD